MTVNKILDNKVPSVLVFLFPIALIVIIVVTAWPLLLMLLLAIVAWQLWQTYQWKQWSEQVNPFFWQLIKEHQGCLTPMDLSAKADLTAKAAQRFLDKKAEEYGAKRQVTEDKGTIYYFMTASALGSIFDESEPPESPTDHLLAPSNTLRMDSVPLEKHPEMEIQETTLESPNVEIEEKVMPESPAIEVNMEIEEEVIPESPAIEVLEEIIPESPNVEIEEEIIPESPNVEIEEEIMPNFPPPDYDAIPDLSLIQADLAKRLELHSSTIGKRKSDPDFSQWSKSKDPEGVAWYYSSETKMFEPIELEEEE